MESFIIVSYLSQRIKNKNHSHSDTSIKNDNHSHSTSLQERESLSFPCAQCGSTATRPGDGRKPGEISISCHNCGKFTGYSPIPKLKRLRKRKRLTDCLEILAQKGVRGDEAIFILSNLGGGEA